ncbi:hypothetical protein fugu_007196 [Takifugu bimaculatus]|uniref:YTH domain-containing protein n=1 Tax=Takifugu bimaculatus TaxID=433685 RepID=A0A4Z2B5S7_9TELE|nr:hypothetical protein fugu_007196 [Takifugu bimaculatus]
MSATSIEPQRSKGQASKVQNGSLHQKETVHDSDFEPYLSGQSTQNNSYQSITDPYLSSYYAPSIGFPYPLSEAPWSTGGDPPIPYLTPYGPLSNGDHHFMPDTVFGQPGGLGSSIYPHRFNFFPENPAFSAWGTSGSQGQQTQSSAYGGSYSYPPSSLGGTLVPDGQTGFHSETLNKAPGMNSLEQGMVGLKIGGDVAGQGSGVKAVGSVIGGPAVPTAGNGATPIGMPPPKPTSWAAIASKPAKPQQLKTKVKPGMPGSLGGALPPPPIKHNMNIGTWDKGPVTKVAAVPPAAAAAAARPAPRIAASGSHAAGTHAAPASAVSGPAPNATHGLTAPAPPPPAPPAPSATASALPEPRPAPAAPDTLDRATQPQPGLRAGRPRPGLQLHHGSDQRQRRPPDLHQPGPGGGVPPGPGQAACLPQLQPQGLRLEPEERPRLHHQELLGGRHPPLHQVLHLVQHGARQQAAGLGLPGHERQRPRLPAVQRQRQRPLLRRGRDALAGGLRHQRRRVGAGQVEGQVRRGLVVRQGRAQQPAAPHPPGEQRQQAGDQLPRHPGGPPGEGQAGAEDHRHLQTHHLHL